MSFFSSLTLFHPAKPPRISVGALRELAMALRATVGIVPDSLSTVNLKWGESIDQDHKSMNEVNWDESGMIGTTAEPEWDVSVQQSQWESAWPDSLTGEETLYRGYISIGSLTPEASKSLTAYLEGSDYEYIAPDCASVEIDPICPGTLATDEPVCTGLVALNFAGNGYFSWRNFEEYSTQYRDAAPVASAMSLCRDAFPVKRDERFDKIDNHLGELFLNRDFYQEGDWILSVSESG